MSQTKRQSLKESICNIVIGYTIAVISQVLIFPLVGVQATLNQNLQIGVYFTIISLLRSYAIRRYFNGKEQ